MYALNSPMLQPLLDRLHRAADEEAPAMTDYYMEHMPKEGLSNLQFDDEAYQFLSGKMVALEPEKAQFCHLLCRMLKAQQVIEVGTSHGVSTLYLADAVQGNGGGRVIGTEHHAHKAQIAKQHFAEAGLEDLIDLREGDLRETLKIIDKPIDFVLIDIWMEMACPAIELIAPHLVTGAVVICDNTATYREAYSDYLDYIGNPDHGFITQTLPFDGGLEFSVKV